MKKKIINLIWCFSIFCCILSANVYATPNTLEKRVNEIYDGYFINDESFGKAASEEAVEALAPQNLFVCIAESIKKAFSDSVGFFLTVAAILILSGLSTVFGKSLGGFEKITNLVAVLALIFICLQMTSSVLMSISGFLEKHTAVMTSLSSAMCLLLGASGAAAGAASSSASAAFIISFIQTCTSGVLLPAVKIIIVLSCISALSPGLDISGIISFLKSFCTFGIGLLFAVFLSVHSLAVSVSQSADTLAFKSIRFTFARLVPIAGGMISESLKTVLAGINLIKSASGAVGIAYIIYTAIPTVLPILVLKFVTWMGSSFSKLLGTSRHTAFLDGLNQAYSLVFALCIFAVFGGIIILAVFMNTTVNA